ncbi:hypothetical protein LCGC14_0234780 [marine sediment metagenome]|uniref:Uncharacterized protein n=1 Tax=marine sediment metagenome TaxID=412755 RepID=A0A0F9UQ39_9ZZZZ
MTEMEYQAVSLLRRLGEEECEKPSGYIVVSIAAMTKAIAELLEETWKDGECVGNKEGYNECECEQDT